MYSNNPNLFNSFTTQWKFFATSIYTETKKHKEHVTKVHGTKVHVTKVHVTKVHVTEATYYMYLQLKYVATNHSLLFFAISPP